MINRKTLLTSLFLFLALHPLRALPLAEQFQQKGYVEICDEKNKAEIFHALYMYFDEL